MSKNTLWIVPIESIETRYTKHWHKHLSKQISDAIPEITVTQITTREECAPENSEGGFFNFNWSVGYKSQQISVISSLFSDGKVKDGDAFLFTDYWNPGVGFLRYMSQLSGIGVKIAGIAHAGVWDPADILSQKLSSWSYWNEVYLDSCYDEIYFSTEFSRSLYEDALGEDFGNHFVTGFPMEYSSSELPPYWTLNSSPEKENIIVFPHRKSPEKGLGKFLELEKMLPEYEFVVALDHCKTKEDYHSLLYRAKVTVSFATQETLGISMGIESLLAQCIPLVPERLSYKEIYSENPEFFISDDVSEVARKVRSVIDNYSNLTYNVKGCYNRVSSGWFSGEKMYARLRKLVGV